MLLQLLGTETVEMLFFALAHMLPQQHTHEIEAVRARARGRVCLSESPKPKSSANPRAGCVSPTLLSTLPSC